MAYFCFVYVNSMSLVLALALALKLWSLALGDSVFQVLGLVCQVLVNITGCPAISVLVMAVRYYHNIIECPYVDRSS